VPDLTSAPHDTELCAWWHAPCDALVYSQDLCRAHYNKAWWAGEKAPRFTVVRKTARTHHALSEFEDETSSAVCALCGPTRYRWAGTAGRGSGRRRACIRSQAANMRWRTTGWSEEAYDLAVIAQGNRCAVCGQSPEGRGRHGVLQGDHCHASGRTRALLCGQCNHVLGLVDDQPELLQRAVEYLARHLC
jgi:hypothetical protein